MDRVIVGCSWQVEDRCWFQSPPLLLLSKVWIACSWALGLLIAVRRSLDGLQLLELEEKVVAVGGQNPLLLAFGTSWKARVDCETSWLLLVVFLVVVVVAKGIFGSY